MDSNCSVHNEWRPMLNHHIVHEDGLGHQIWPLSLYCVWYNNGPPKIVFNYMGCRTRAHSSGHFILNNSQAHILRCGPKKTLNPRHFAPHHKMWTCLKSEMSNVFRLILCQLHSECTGFRSSFRVETKFQVDAQFRDTTNHMAVINILKGRDKLKFGFNSEGWSKSRELWVQPTENQSYTSPCTYFDPQCTGLFTLSFTSWCELADYKSEMSIHLLHGDLTHFICTELVRLKEVVVNYNTSHTPHNPDNIYYTEQTRDQSQHT